MTLAAPCRRIAQLPGVVISVDTFYSKVARAAVNAGAHIVNDVTGGKGDASMLRTVRPSPQRPCTSAFEFTISLAAPLSACGPVGAPDSSADIREQC